MLTRTAPHAVAASHFISRPLLARALSAHPSLTALHLDATFLHTSWIRNLAAALSQDLPPALTDLRLGIRLLPAGLPELAACIRHVPTLTRLAIGTLLPPSAAAPVCLRDISTVAATPTPLPALRRLSFSEVAHSSDGDPVATPHGSCIHIFLPLITAPALECLAFTTTAASLPYRSFLAALSKFSALQEISIDAEVADASDGDCRTDWAAGGTLPALRDIQISSASALTPTLLAAALAANAGGALTSLCMQRTGCDGTPDHRWTPDYAVDVAAGWCDMLRVLRACAGMRQMELRNLGWTVRDAETIGSALASALQQMTGLTHLVLQAAPSHGRGSWRPVTVLPGACLAEVLPKMSELHTLVLCSGTGKLRVAEAQRVLGACTQLPVLRMLGVCCGGVGAEQILRVLPALRGLTGLELHAATMHEGGGKCMGAMREKRPGLMIWECGVDD